MKKVINRLLVMLIIAPCLLICTQGENEEPTIVNLIGLVYLALLILIMKMSSIRQGNKVNG